MKCFIIFSIFCSLLILLLGVSNSYSVHNNSHSPLPFYPYYVDSLDSVSTISPDSVLQNTLPYRISKDTLDAEVVYNAKDSIRFSILKRKMYLFGEAVVIYENINLKADYIELDWSKNLIIAEGYPDSLGNFKGYPVFSEDNQTYNAEKITYNFKTKKGKIEKFFTKEGEGYVHGEQVLKSPKDELFVSKGKYTTCNLKKPHFYIAISKLKIIPKKAIITGPANLVIEGIPTPLAIPFGMFPISDRQKSGILFPEYGESANLGFFLKNGGYYFAISDKIDLAVQGDIYSKSSWRLNLASNYAKRYKYKGNININYAITKIGEVNDPSFSVIKDFFIRWKYERDRRSHPTRYFSANVNFGTNTYHQNNSYNTDEFLSNVFQSNIVYRKKWVNSPFNLTVNLRHSQNKKTGIVNLTLPDATFNMARIQPFKKKKTIGSKKWYEKIGLSYNAKFKNHMSIPDTILFQRLIKNGLLSKENNEGVPDSAYSTDISSYLKYGLKHNIPISASFKIFKHFTLSPSFNYTELWYWQTVEKIWDNTSNTIITNDIAGFKQSRFFNSKISMNTRLYGILNFKGKGIKAIRHVFSPTVSFNYRPDFAGKSWGYYKYVQSDSLGNIQRYSIFEKGIYGSAPAGKQGAIAFNLNNNLEMKVYSKKDTVNHSKKIKILESLSFGASYNLAVDSLNWSNITMNGYTNIFKNRVRLNFGSTFDPYVSDSLNRRLNRFEFDENGRIARLTNANLSLGTNFKSANKNKQKESTKKAENTFVDFNIPWSFSINYNILYNRKFINKVDTATITQSVSLRLMLNLTPKWKVTVNSGYDFVKKDFTYTTIDIYRDLHCWELKFKWVPFGNWKSYSVAIKVKSAILQDLKISKRKDWYDY